jgi:hypothetical protein
MSKVVDIKRTFRGQNLDSLMAHWMEWLTLRRSFKGFMAGGSWGKWEVP